MDESTVTYNPINDSLVITFENVPALSLDKPNGVLQRWSPLERETVGVEIQDFTAFWLPMMLGDDEAL